MCTNSMAARELFRSGGNLSAARVLASITPRNAMEAAVRPPS